MKWWLSLGAIVLSIIRIALFHDLVIPVTILVAALLIIWLDEHKVVGHEFATVLLTLAVILQAFLYVQWLGPVLTYSVAAAAILLLWYRQIADAVGASTDIYSVPRPSRLRRGKSRRR